MTIFRDLINRSKCRNVHSKTDFHTWTKINTIANFDLTSFKITSYNESHKFKRFVRFFIDLSLAKRKCHDTIDATNDIRSFKTQGNVSCLTSSGLTSSNAITRDHRCRASQHGLRRSTKNRDSWRNTRPNMIAFMFQFSMGRALNRISGHVFESQNDLLFYITLKHKTHDTNHAFFLAHIGKVRTILRRPRRAYKGSQ